MIGDRREARSAEAAFEDELRIDLHLFSEDGLDDVLQRADRAVERGWAGWVFNELLEWAAQSFAFEDQLLECLDAVEASAHRAEHHSFLQAITDAHTTFVMRPDRRQRTLEATLRYAACWAERHFSRFDGGEVELSMERFGAA